MDGDSYYLAPEDTRNSKFTEEMDIYAAGIIMLEIITLRAPNTNLINLLPLIVKNPECPRSLRVFLAATLDEDPAKRSSFLKLLVILKEGRRNIVDAPESFFFCSKSGKSSVRVSNK
jgi:serine/threonine protein kinase